MTGPLRAFVIMPFDPEFDAVYTDLIVPPLTSAGFVVRRADDVEARQNVLVDVVRGIAEADLVVADLTTVNANVFYELGLAHAMGVPTVLIAHQEAADDVPFDLRQYRTEFYDTHFQRARAIVEVLGKLGRSHVAGEIAFGSPISDFLPGAAKPMVHARRTSGAGLRVPALRTGAGHRGSRPQAAQEEVGEADLEGDGALAVELADERGLVDFMESISAGSEKLERISKSLVAATERVGADVTSLAHRFNDLEPGSPAGQTQAKRLLLQTAHVLDAYAEGLESEQPEFESAVETITSSGLGYVTLLAETPDQFRDQIEEVLTTSRDLQDVVAESTGELMGLRDGIAGLPPMLKQSNRARNRSVRALDALLAQFDRVRSYAEQSIGLAEAGLEQLGAEEHDDDDAAPGDS